MCAYVVCMFIRNRKSFVCNCICLSYSFVSLALLVWPGSVRIVVVRGDGTGDCCYFKGPDHCRRRRFRVASAGASAIIDSVGESAIDSSAGGVGSSSSS